MKKTLKKKKPAGVDKKKAVKKKKPTFVRGVFGSSFNSPAVIVLLLNRTMFDYKVVTSNPADELKVLALKKWCEKDSGELDKVVIFTKFALVRQWCKKINLRQTKLVVFDSLDRLLLHRVRVLDSEFNKQLGTYIRGPISPDLLNNALKESKNFGQKQFSGDAGLKSKEVVSATTSVKSIPSFLHRDSLEYLLKNLEHYLVYEDYNALSLSCFESLAGITRRGPFNKIKKAVFANTDIAKARSLINTLAKIVDKQYKKTFLAMAVMSTTRKKKKFAVTFSGCSLDTLNSVLVFIQPSAKLVFSYKIPKKVAKLKDGKTTKAAKAVVKKKPRKNE